MGFLGILLWVFGMIFLAVQFLIIFIVAVAVLYIASSLIEPDEKKSIRNKGILVVLSVTSLAAILTAGSYTSYIFKCGLASALPPTSCDTSFWSHGIRYGGILYDFEFLKKKDGN